MSVMCCEWVISCRWHIVCLLVVLCHARLLVCLSVCWNVPSSAIRYLPDDSSVRVRVFTCPYPSDAYIGLESDDVKNGLGVVN